MMRRNFAAFAALCVAGPVFAQNALPDSSWIVALDVAHHEFELGVTPGGTLTDKAVAYSIAGGYQFSRFVAVELAVFDAERVGIRNSAGAVDLRILGLQPSAVVNLPLGPYFALYGRAGYSLSRFKVRATAGTLSATDTSNENAAVFGGGISAVFDNARIRLEYQQVDYGDLASIPGSTPLSLSGKSKFIRLGVLWSISGRGGM